MRVKLRYDLVPKDTLVSFSSNKKLANRIGKFVGNLNAAKKFKFWQFEKVKLDINLKDVESHLIFLGFKREYDLKQKYFSKKNILIELYTETKLENGGKSPCAIYVFPRLEKYNSDSRDFFICILENLSKKFNLKMFSWDEKKVVTVEQMKNRLKYLKIRKGTYEDVVRDAKYYSKFYGRELK